MADLVKSKKRENTYSCVQLKADVNFGNIRNLKIVHLSAKYNKLKKKKNKRISDFVDLKICRRTDKGEKTYEKILIKNTPIKNSLKA